MKTELTAASLLVIAVAGMGIAGETNTAPRHRLSSLRTLVTLVTSMEQTNEQWDWPGDRLSELYQAMGCCATSGFSRVSVETCPPVVQQEITNTYRLFRSNTAIVDDGYGTVRLMAFVKQDIYRLTWLYRMKESYWKNRKADVGSGRIWEGLRRDVDVRKGRVVACLTIEAELPIVAATKTVTGLRGEVKK